jgi:U4/U6.U5 tri-snRNP component SNU23
LQVGGYWCEVCQCTLRDSATYLDHINGVRHQRRMGFSMRTEKSTVESVKVRGARCALACHLHCTL